MAISMALSSASSLSALSLCSSRACSNCLTCLVDASRALVRLPHLPLTLAPLSRVQTVPTSRPISNEPRTTIAMLRDRLQQEGYGNHLRILDGKYHHRNQQQHHQYEQRTHLPDVLPEYQVNTSVHLCLRRRYAFCLSSDTSVSSLSGALLQSYPSSNFPKSPASGPK